MRGHVGEQQHRICELIIQIIGDAVDDRFAFAHENALQPLMSGDEILRHAPVCSFHHTLLLVRQAATADSHDYDAGAER